MKRYLLIAGDSDYPQRGTEGWIDSYDEKEDAMKSGRFLLETRRDVDWYCVVDLHSFDPLNDDLAVCYE